MSLQDVVDQTVGIIPVVLTAGVAMKMVDWMSSKMQTSQLVTSGAKKKKDIYSREFSGSFGDFSNLGW